MRISYGRQIYSQRRVSGHDARFQDEGCCFGTKRASKINNRPLVDVGEALTRASKKERKKEEKSKDRKKGSSNKGKKPRTKVDVLARPRKPPQKIPQKAEKSDIQEKKKSDDPNSINPTPRPNLRQKKERKYTKEMLKKALSTDNRVRHPFARQRQKGPSPRRPAT